MAISSSQYTLFADDKNGERRVYVKGAKSIEKEEENAKVKGENAKVRMGREMNEIVDLP